MELELILAPTCEELAALDDACLTQRFGLAPDELERGRSLHFERDRVEHLSARALVRAVLSARLGVSPATLAFERGRWGRPRLAGAAASAVDFNLAHASGLLALVLGSPSARIGVDVEDTSRPRDLAVASDFFATSEVIALAALPRGEQLARFYHLWTAKEAYIKARGMGLAIPLDTFAFHFTASGGARLELDPRAPPLEDGEPDDGAAWSLTWLERGAHLVAVACSPKADAIAVHPFSWPALTQQ